MAARRATTNADKSSESKRRYAPKKLRCQCCDDEIEVSEFYDTESEMFRGTGKIPYCKECITYLFENYQEDYEKKGYAYPEKKAVERICMMLDLYYSDMAFDSAYKRNNDENSRMSSSPLIIVYMSLLNLKQYRGKNYNTTINERYEIAKREDQAKVGYDVNFYTEDDAVKGDIIKSSMKLFGTGFSNDDYMYLYDQYCDWTSRHECNTKAQEEVFKNICLTQLQLHSATLRNDDPKNIAAISTQLQKWLDTGNLQPKQNSGDTVSDAQTFGTLIDKWENTRPTPDIDPSLEDVDKLGIFAEMMRCHLAKAAGIQNVYSEKYDDFMRKFSVEREEYYNEEDNAAIYEALFGVGGQSGSKDE